MSNKLKRPSSVCEGTVVSFTTTGGCKCSIQYTDSTTAALTVQMLGVLVEQPHRASHSA